MGLNELYLEDKCFELSIHRDSIHAAIDKIAIALNERFKHLRITILVIMDGAEPFAKNLLPKLNFEYSVDYLQIKTYVGMKSSKEISLNPDSIGLIAGSEVVILEDIIDTGNTLEKLSQFLTETMDCKIHIVTLFHKRNIPHQRIKPDFIGLEIDNAFVIGFGMDYNEKGRTLEHIYRLKQE